MSEALTTGPLLQANPSAKTAAPKGQPEPAKQPEGTEFPMLFGSMMLPNAEPATLPTSLPALQGEGSALLKGPAEAPRADPQLQREAGKHGNLLPAHLPQLALKGVIAVDNGEQAAAMTLQGDGKALRAGQPVVSQDLSQALRQAFAQQQVMANQGDKAANTSSTLLNSPMLNNENFKLDLTNLNQAFTDQLAREADSEPTHAIKPSTPNTSHASNAASGSSSTLNALSSMNSQLNTGARADAGNSQSVSVPPQHPQWGQQVGDRVQWMVGQNLQRADIRLHPPELGSVEVRIQVNGDQQTNVSFHSPHAQVRDALESALPRLREMMNDSGLNLGDVDVSQHSFAESHPQEGFTDGGDGHGRAGANANSADNAADGGAESPAVTTVQGEGMVDFYA